MEQTRPSSSISPVSSIPLQGPLYWYGRKVSDLKHCPQTVCEVAALIINSVEVIFLSPLLLLILPMAALGYGAWHVSKHFSPPPVVEPPTPPLRRFPSGNLPSTPPISDIAPSGSDVPVIVEAPKEPQEPSLKDIPPSTPPISDIAPSSSDVSVIVDDPKEPQEPSLKDNPPPTFPISDIAPSGSDVFVIVEAPKQPQEPFLKDSPPSTPPISHNTSSGSDVSPVEDPIDLPPSNFSPTIGDETLRILREDGWELENLVETLCKNLKQIEGNLGRELERKLLQFEERYSKYRSIQGTDKSFTIFDESKRLFEITQRSHTAYCQYLQAQGADYRGVIPQLKDGNCWLHTALCGLQYLGKGEGFDHESLREVVIQWMEANQDRDPSLREALYGNQEGTVVGAIDGHITVERSHIQIEAESLEAAKDCQLITQQEFDGAMQQIRARRDILANFTLKDYFAHMAKNGSHGSRAELYAISKIFEVNVKIWIDREEGLTSEFHLPIMDLRYDSDQWIHVVLNQAGNHFDYLVSEDMTLSMPLS